MSSAKAQLESDTRTLAYEAGRKWGVRVNTISAGPLKVTPPTHPPTHLFLYLFIHSTTHPPTHPPKQSRAASAIGGGAGKKTFIEYAIDYSKANAPLAQDLYADDVGSTGLFLSSPLARCVTVGGWVGGWVGGLSE